MLEENTIRLMAELFAGKQCRSCGYVAQRLWHDRYYCRDCFPGVRPPEVRVHQASVPEGARLPSRN